MVKKTYIIPEALSIVLGSMQMIAASEPNVIVDPNPDDEIEAGDVEVKGITVGNLWNDAW